jgi:hypothetical protein
MTFPTLFRAFSAVILHWFSPGPMAQAFTFRAFGAENPGVLTQPRNYQVIIVHPRLDQRKL